MNRSRFFTLQELTRTDTKLPNIPSWEAVENLNRLALFLDRIRSLYGGPVFVNSGFRSQAVNELVGGVKNSAHLQGLAADIRADDMDRLFLCVESQTGDMDGYSLDQLIVYPKFLHVGISRTPRRQILYK